MPTRASVPCGWQTCRWIAAFLRTCWQPPITESPHLPKSAEVQPTINVPYLYYIRALAKDYLLHKKEYSGEPVTKDELEGLKEEYALLLSEFPELMRHAHTIKMRTKMLKFVKAE